MLFFFSSRRRHTRSLCDWSSDVCSSDLIEGMPAGLARVKTISLGGAYLESPQKLTVGDSIKLEVRAGLRKITFTAVVRKIGRASCRERGWMWAVGESGVTKATRQSR